MRSKRKQFFSTYLNRLKLAANLIIFALSLVLVIKRLECKSIGMMKKNLHYFYLNGNGNSNGAVRRNYTGNIVDATSMSKSNNTFQIISNDYELFYTTISTPNVFERRQQTVKQFYENYFDLEEGFNLAFSNRNKNSVENLPTTTTVITTTPPQQQQSFYGGGGLLIYF
jgi:hypothetical protein